MLSKLSNKDFFISNILWGSGHANEFQMFITAWKFILNTGIKQLNTESLTPKLKSSYFRAQFGENQTIFNTPNPRLMNASMVKGISLKRKTFVQGGWDENILALWVEPDHPEDLEPEDPDHCKYSLSTFSFAQSNSGTI